jgi:hypothetical protein
VRKPATADGYTPEQLLQVRTTCLHLASVLGDLLDELVVVGGLVPSLLVDPRRPGTEAHVGTTDLDLGLELALLDTGRYRTLAERLRSSAFLPDRNPEGNLTRQRWRHPGSRATVDFLLPPVRESQRGGTLQDLESDLAAVVLPGLPLAFRDRERVLVEGRTLLGERLSREVPVCGPGAFVALKALAFRNRGENKDAYDLYYVLSWYGSEVEDVGRRVRPLLDDRTAREAIGYLREDFARIDSLGPVRAAAFLGRSDDDGFKADVAGLVLRMLRSL